ncbi:MAG: phytoene/squalene synthase family protein [Thiohalocapsa sp.]
MKGETTPARLGLGGGRGPAGLSPLAALVRLHDRDRYQTALFAPAARREALFALYAFNYEVARIRESVTEPMLGQIRLQWWREAVAAAYAGEPPRAHIVAEPLTAAIRAHGLSRTLLDRLIDAREQDLADAAPATLAALEEYADGTAATVVRLALQILGFDVAYPHPDAPPQAGEGADGAAPSPSSLPRWRGRAGMGVTATADAAHNVGIAYAIAGLLRAMAFHARAGRSYIPQDVAAETGLDLDDYARLRSTPALRAATERLAEAAAAHLRLARQRRREARSAALPALLPTVVAETVLRRLRRADWNPFDPALAAPDPLLPWRLGAAMLRRRF